MKIVQKIVYIMALIVAALFFLFTLSFSTGWALGEPLGDFFTNAQAANKDIFPWAVRTIVAAAFIIVFNTHKVKQLFILNYLVVAVTVGLMIYSAILTMGYMGPLSEQYAELNPLLLTLITAVNYSSVENQIFDIGMWVSYIMLAEAALLVIFTSYKFYDQIRRAKLKKHYKMGASE